MAKAVVRKRKVEFTAQEYYHFFGQIRKQFGFSFITRYQFDEMLRSKTIFKKKAKEGGRELGLILFLNDCTIVVWSTFVPDLGRQRKEDAAWVLFIQDGIKKYTSPKILRTKNFFNTLWFYIQKMYEMAYSNPMCVKCRRFLRIVIPDLKFEDGKIKRLGSRWRACPNEMTHHSRYDRQKIRVSIDNGLSEDILLRTKKIRKQKSRKRRQAEEKGQTYGISRIQRSQRAKGLPVIKQ